MSDDTRTKVSGLAAAGSGIGAIVSLAVLSEAAPGGGTRLALSAIFGALMSVTGVAANFWLSHRRLSLDADAARLKHATEREAQYRAEELALRLAYVEENKRLRDRNDATEQYWQRRLDDCEKEMQRRLDDCEKGARDVEREKAELDARFDELYARYRDMQRHTPPGGRQKPQGGQ